MSMAKAVFIPPAELVVFLRLSTQKERARGTCRALLLSIRSALDGTAGDAGDDLVGQEDVQKEGGRKHDDHRSEHAAIIIGVLHAFDHIVQAHGDGADCRLAGKQHRHEELVPDGDEVEDGNGDNAGLRQREHEF